MSLQGYLPGKTAQLQKAGGIPPDPPGGIWYEQKCYELGNLALLRAAYDSTNHGASFYRDNLKGVYEKIEYPISLNYQTYQYTEFKVLLDEDPGERWWRIALPDGFYISFMASVSHVGDTTPRDERITYDVVLTVSEVVDFGT